MERKRPIMSCCMVVGIFMLITFGIVPTSHASVFKWIGYDTAAISGMNMDFAYGEGAGVLYTNPALMSRFKPHSSIEYLMYKPNFEVKLGDRPANADVPYLYYNTDTAPISELEEPYKALATAGLLTQRSDTKVDSMHSNLAFGGTHDFGIEGFRIGGCTVLPLANSISVHGFYSDEREQFFSNQVRFSRFGEWQTIVAGFLGVSYAYKNWISVGASVQITASMITELQIYTPDQTVQSYMLTNADAKMHLKFRPIIGVQSEPFEWLSLGITWRNESYVDVGGSGTLNMWGLHESVAIVGNQTVLKPVITELNMAFDYEPMEISAGIGARYKIWQIQLGMTWERWSQYKDIHGERPQESAEFSRSNFGAPLINGNDFKWSDTISAGFNTKVQYFSNDKMQGSLKLGFAWHPSPVPPQVGRTSYADSDTWGVSLGNRFDFEVKESKFYVELGLQFWQMLERTTYKDPNQIRDDYPDGFENYSYPGQTITSAQGLQTNNPGFPSYEVSGWMMVMGLSAHYKF